MGFDPREYFGEELAARGMKLQECVGTVKRWYLSSAAPLTPLAAWAIANMFQTSSQVWLDLEAAWQEANKIKEAHQDPAEQRETGEP
jgi:plasmid maintenance system antidote protein VapI